MNKKRSRIAISAVIALGIAAVLDFPTLAASTLSGPQAEQTGQAALARRIGAIKAITGSAITLTPDSGPDVTVTIQPNARILRIAPGEKDLKNATPVQLQDIHVADRIRVRGQASADATSIAALEIIVMARTDLEARHDQERQDWQKRGLGGLVSSVDPASGTISISVTGLGGTKSIAIHTAAKTVFRRYAPDSVKFDDAKPGTLLEIHSGDQLRARGDRSPDGSELTAEEVVTGSFRNVAGTVNSVDASAGTISVQDLLSKKPVVVRITGESQLHKLPPEMAQRFAMRLKGTVSGAPGASSASGSSQVAGNGAPAGHASESVKSNGSAGSAGVRQGGTDFQQILNRMPPVTLADLHKGDAVLIVATQGSSSGGGTAITLLSGVEPILQAAPNGSQAMMLTPWSLGGAPGADAMQ